MVLWWLLSQSNWIGMESHSNEERGEGWMNEAEKEEKVTRWVEINWERDDLMKLH